MLQQLARMLDDETIKAEVAEVVAAEVKYLRFVGLDNVAGRYATEKMVAGVVRLVGEMGSDPAASPARALRRVRGRVHRPPEGRSRVAR